MSLTLAALDFSAFSTRASSGRGDPRFVARAGHNLVKGALRIRRGITSPVSEDEVVNKPAEAIGAWLKSIENDVHSGEPFLRSAELRKATIAAGKEVDAAARAASAHDSEEADQLRSALYIDALGAIGTPQQTPWAIIAGVLGGILIGVLMTRKAR